MKAAEHVRNDDVYLARHPTQLNQWVFLRNHTSLSSVLIRSRDPLGMVISPRLAQSSQLDLRGLLESVDIEVSTGFEAPSLRVPVLQVSGVDPASLIECSIWVAGPIVVATFSEIGRMRIAWPRNSVADLTRSVRRIAQEVLGSNPSMSAEALAEGISSRIIDEGRMLLLAEVTAASNVLERIATQSGSNSIADAETLWHVRSRLRQSEDVLRSAGLENSILTSTYSRVIADVDSVSNLAMVHSIAVLNEESRQSREEARHSDLLEREADAKLQRNINNVNKRISVLGASFLLPGLWLAFWAVPASEVAAFGRKFSEFDTRIWLAVGVLMLALAGYGFARLSVSHDRGTEDHR